MFKSERRVSRHHHLRHWHHIYLHRRRRALKINAKQMSYGQILSLVGSIVAGLLLDINKTTLAALAGAFVVLPGVFDLGGSLGASLSAKINHRLEDPRQSAWRVLWATTLFTFGIAVSSGLIVAVVGAGIAELFFDAVFWKVFVLAELSIILCAVFGFPLIGSLSVLFRKHGINPDDVVGPIESSLFDILTVIFLSLVAGWLL